MSNPQEKILTEEELNEIEALYGLQYEEVATARPGLVKLLASHRAQTEYIEALEASAIDFKRYNIALRRIVCLNIPMPDEVFNLANNALEGIE